MANFINYIKKYKFEDFNGQILLCSFDLENWCDDLFNLHNIFFPENIKISISKRKAHYFAGRFLSKIILSKMGIIDFNLLSGTGNEPLWPKNIIGSLSHTENHAICAITLPIETTVIGIDIQEYISKVTANEIWSSIITSSEKEFLSMIKIDFPILLTLVFSAKESLLKALYPSVKYFFDFDSAKIIQFNFIEKTFTLELSKNLNHSYNCGRRFKGRFEYLENSIITFISY